MAFLSKIFGNPSKRAAAKGSSSSLGNSSAPPNTISPSPVISESPSTSTPAANLKPLTNADKFTFLQELTSTQKHYKKTFYEHLFNVYSHLEAQSCPQEVCDAGLFHSIYGTEFYQFQNNRITRDVVRGIIGDYAEELVFIFCTSRPRFKVIVENSLGLSTQQVMDLCHVEFANLSDQNDRHQCDEKLRILRETITKLQNGEQVGVSLGSNESRSA